MRFVHIGPVLGMLLWATASYGGKGQPAPAKPIDAKVAAVANFKAAVKGSGSWRFNSTKCGVTYTQDKEHWRLYDIGNTGARALKPSQLRLRCSDGSDCIVGKDNKASTRTVALPQAKAKDAAQAWNALANACRNE